MTATFPLSDLTSADLAPDPNVEVELRDIGILHVEVRHHVASNTCLVSIDRDALRRLVGLRLNLNDAITRALDGLTLVDGEGDLVHSTLIAEYIIEELGE